MAYTASDKYAPLIVEWGQAMVDYQPTWSSLAQVRTDQAFSIRNYADITPGALASWDGSANITQASTPYGSSHEQTVEAAGLARRITISQRDAGLNPGLVEKKAEELLAAAQRTVEKEFYTALDALFVTSVDNGGGGTTGVLGGTFTLQDGTTQSNALAAALSSTSLATARETMMKWKDYNGDYIGLGNGPLSLVVSPKNADVAVQVTGSPLLREESTDTNGIAVSGANINAQASRPYSVIVSPYLAGSGVEDDWFLVETGAQSPLVVWQAQAPKLVIEEHAINQTIEMSVSMYLKVYCQTPPAGIIGSNMS